MSVYIKKILYLPVETTARELDSKLLLAHRAISRGYIVIIGRKKNVKGAAMRIGFGTYLHKDHIRESFPEDGESSYFYYLALDEEGLVFFNDKKYLKRARPKKIEYLDIVFTSGPYQRNLLVRENPSLKNKTMVVGNPRFDLLRPEFFPFYSLIKKKLRSKWGKYILINTNFGAGNWSRHYKTDYVTHMERLKEISSNRDREYYRNRRTYYEQLFKFYIEMLRYLSSKFPDINFILRPHPNEDHENWRKALKGLKNVKVIYKGSVIDWIQGALAVIHNACTTGIEAWALNKPVFRYNPASQQKYEDYLPTRFGYNFSSINNLEEGIKKVLKEGIRGTFNEQASVAKPFIRGIQGKYSSERIMDELEKLPIKQNFKNKVSLPFNYLRSILYGPEEIKFYLFRFLVRHMRLFSIIVGRKKAVDIYSRIQKFSSVSKKYIKRRFSQLNVIFKESHGNSYKIRKIAADTYMIQKS